MCSFSKFQGAQILTGLQFLECSIAPHVKECHLKWWVKYLTRRQERLRTCPIIPIADGNTLVIRRKSKASIVSDNQEALFKQLHLLDFFREASGFARDCNLDADHACVCTDSSKRLARHGLGPALKFREAS